VAATRGVDLWEERAACAPPLRSEGIDPDAPFGLSFLLGRRAGLKAGLMWRKSFASHRSIAIAE
jgi:hypothetical protein